MRRLMLFVFLVNMAILPVVASAQESDLDGDGLPDAVEDKNGNGIVDPDETDPQNADTDGGGESDGSEEKAGRDPLDPTDDLTYDTDGDGWANGIELLRGTDPAKKDTDGDGVDDPFDPFPLDPSFTEDTDGNGLPDEWEDLTNLRSVPNQNATSDADGDGLSNFDEFKAGTDPLRADTDRDGLLDSEEVSDETNPRENACLAFGPIKPAFPDTNGHWSKEYVARLQRTLTAPADTPVVSGYTIDDEIIFLPNREVTRYEFLKMVLLSNCVPLAENTIDVPVRFSDVNSIPKDEETTDDIQRRQVIYTAVQQSIVAGYSDGTFKPDALINRAEALKILLEATRLVAPLEATNMSRIFPDVPIEAWYLPYLSKALWYEIVGGYSDGTFKPENNLTRAEAAKIIFSTMIVNPYINGYVIPLLE